LAACASTSSSASSDNFPDNPIRISVGFPAGAITDTATRTLAEAMKKNLPNNVDIAIENKPGGGGVVAVTDVVNSTPDGYDITFTPNGPLTIHTHYGNTTYEYDEPTLISQTTQSDFILAVHPDSGWETFEEFKEEALANPGKLSIGTPGAGSRPDLIMQALEEQENIELTPVPFEGNAPARTALLGKDVDGIILSDTDIIPYASDDELKPLINFGETTYEDFPDLPIAAEQGYDIHAFASFFFIGPNDLPNEIVTILDEAIEKSLEDPEVIEVYEQIGLTINYRDSQELKEVIDKEYNNLGKLIHN